MAAGEAYVLEVVVLATGADALLAGGGAGVGALVGAEEDVLELVHACVGEQQGGVVLGDERRGVNAAVLFALEEAKEVFANLGSCAGDHPSSLQGGGDGE